MEIDYKKMYTELNAKNEAFERILLKMKNGQKLLTKNINHSRVA